MIDSDNPAIASWRNDRTLDETLIRRAKVLTIDVFDTLLLRRCGRPDALLSIVAEQAAGLGYFTSRAAAEWFPQLRKEAESVAMGRAASEGRRAITLEEIYAVLPPTFGNLPGLLETEWAVECVQIIANPFLKDLLQDCSARGVPVFLVSDMHLGAERIEKLLSLAGVPRTFYRELLVSCDWGQSKAEGELYQIVLRKLDGIRPSEILHIGDNPHADVAKARQAGFAAVHYEIPDRQRAVIEAEATLGLTPDGSLALRRKLAAHCAAPYDEDAFWFDAGSFLLGPVVDSFARWVLADCRARKIVRIAPIMREGAIFAAAMTHHAAAAGEHFDIRPICLSRQALYLATIERFDRAHLETFAKSNVYRTVDGLLKLHDCAALPSHLEAFRYRTLVELIGMRDVANSDVFHSILDVLLEPREVARIEREAADQRAMVREYLDAEFGDQQPVALVDFGAQGTMNYILETAPGFAGRWALRHYLLYGARNLAQKMLKGLDVKVFAPAGEAGFAVNQVIQRTPQFLELMLNGNVGTTVRFFRTGEGRAAPLKAVPLQNERQCGRLKHVHAGIMACVNLGSIADPWQPDLPDDPQIRSAALGILHRAVHLPTAEEAKLFGDLIYDYGGEREPRRIVDEEASDQIAKLPDVGDAYRLKMALLLQRSAVQWPQGVLTRLDPLAIRAIHEGAMTDMSHGLVCRLIIARLLKAGEQSVVVCAAGGEGGMGPTFINMARAGGLNMVAYLDYFPERIDRVFHGVAVIDRSELARLGCDAFAVVSTGYGDMLETMIGQARPAPLSCRFYRMSSVG